MCLREPPSPPGGFAVHSPIGEWNADNCLAPQCCCSGRLHQSVVLILSVPWFGPRSQIIPHVNRVCMGLTEGLVWLVCLYPVSSWNAITGVISLRSNGLQEGRVLVNGPLLSLRTALSTGLLFSAFKVQCLQQASACPSAFPRAQGSTNPQHTWTTFRSSFNFQQRDLFLWISDTIDRRPTNRSAERARGVKKGKREKQKRRKMEAEYGGYRDRAEAITK